MPDPCSFIGKSIGEVPTPCLTLDYPALMHNLRAIQEFARASGKQLRPHGKTHKCSRLARLQLDQGATGICVAKLSEAEALQRAGIRDILVTGPIVAREAWGRLAACAADNPHLMIVLDNLDVARGIAESVKMLRHPLRCLLDIDAGRHRTGIVPGKVRRFAEAMRGIPELRLCGLQAYAGQAQHVSEYAERSHLARSAMKMTCGIWRELRQAGFDVQILSVGGTGSYEFDVDFPEVTELQCGSYAFMDAEYRALEFPEGSPNRDRFRTALALHSTVVSANHQGFVTVDAGLKTLYRDGGEPVILHPEGHHLSYQWDGDEYGRIGWNPEISPVLTLGARVELMVPHCDPTANLFDFYYVVEDRRVRDVWPIDLRGCSQ